MAAIDELLANYRELRAQMLDDIAHWIWRMCGMRRLVGLRRGLRRRLLYIVGRLPLLLDPTTAQPQSGQERA